MQHTFEDFLQTKRILLPFFKDGLWGFMDEIGRIAIQPAYQSAMFFSEGLAAVKLQGMFGYVNVLGHMEIVQKFLDAESFCGKTAIVFHGGYSIIDKHGDFLLKHKYELLYGIDPLGKTFAARRSNDQKLGIIDSEDCIVWPFVFDDIEGSDECGWWKGSQGRRHVFRDAQGNEKRNFLFDEMSGFHENVAIVGNGGKYGVVDRNGNEVLPIAYHELQLCNAECISVRCNGNGAFRFYYPKYQKWGSIYFDYCISTIRTDLVFIERGGKWSLFDLNENCIIEDFADEIGGCAYGKFQQFWRDSANMEYIIIDNAGIRFLKQETGVGQPYDITGNRFGADGTINLSIMAGKDSP